MAQPGAASIPHEPTGLFLLRAIKSYIYVLSPPFNHAEKKRSEMMQEMKYNEQKKARPSQRQTELLRIIRHAFPQLRFYVDGATISTPQDTAKYFPSRR